MGFAGFKQRMLSGKVLAGTFVKTPAIEVIEVLAHSGLDFLCLDAEHAPFDRARLDACLAVARALDLPTLVRVPSGSSIWAITIVSASWAITSGMPRVAKPAQRDDPA